MKSRGLCVLGHVTMHIPYWWQFKSPGSAVLHNWHSAGLAFTRIPVTHESLELQLRDKEAI